MRSHLLIPVLLTCICVSAAPAQNQPQSDQSSIVRIFTQWRAANISFAVAFPDFGTFSCHLTAVREDSASLSCNNLPQNFGDQLNIWYSGIVAILGPLGRTPSNSRLVVMSSSGRVG